MASNDPFRDILSRVDLDAASVKAARSNDLIPARPEDKVAGRIGNRFSESLRHLIERGEYDPTPAHFIPVPKGGATTRPAALMTLADRTIYQAIMDDLAPRVEETLMDNRVVFGPRATTATRPWSEFEQAPLQHACTHVSLIDVAAFYEMVPHGQLLQLLIEATGRHMTVHALSLFLERVMGSPRGLPQGLIASDILATLYLTPVDQTMLRAGHRYVRRGDDMRVAVDSYSDGLAVLAEIEAELRNLGLILNPAKSKIVRAETYRRQIEAVEIAQQAIRDRLGSERVERLYQMAPEDLADLAIEELAGESELEEFFFGVYHGEMSPEEIIEQLEDRVQPSDVEVAEALFREAIVAAPGSNSGAELSKEEFHGRVATALTILTAARAEVVLNELEWLLIGFPDETSGVVSYLSALAPSRPAEVVSRIESFLLPSRYRPPWQEAMLLAVTVPEADNVSDDFERQLVHTIGNETTEWLVRVLAARVLARRGHLTRDDLNRLWQLAPAPFRPDLVAAAADLSASAAWASDFLRGCRGDVVLETIEKDTLGAAEVRELVRRASAARGTDEYQSMRVESRIFHARWGVGRIVSISGEDHLEAIVDFSGVERHLVLSFAPVILLEQNHEK